MRGRKPKPTAQRLREGNPGGRPINRQEPALPPETFDAVPPELAGVPRAIAEWQHLAPVLRQRRAVTTADRSALIALCLEWSRYLDASAQATPLVISTKSGYPMPNPYLSVASKALAACARLWPELGLTPSSRSRVRIDTPPGDEFAEFDEAPPDPPPPPTTTTH
jgi:P27 family predicted phage terminase small subunit